MYSIIEISASYEVVEKLWQKKSQPQTAHLQIAQGVNQSLQKSYFSPTHKSAYYVRCV